MADSVELASAYVSLAVSTKGLGKDLVRSFAGVDKIAALSGLSSGAAFAKAMASGSKKAGTDLGKATAESAKKAEDAVKNAAVGIRSARESEATATRKVAIEEAKLKELRASGKTSTSRILSAEDRLATARTKEALATDKVSSSVRTFRKAQDDATKELKQAETQAKKTGGAFAGLGGKLKIAAAAGALALGAGLAVASRGLKEAVNKAGDFEKSMNLVQVTTGETGQGLKDLTALAIDMGAKTSFSAQGASDAMVELAKGGLTSAQIKAGALQSTLTLATAGGLDLGNAAEFMVQGLTSFGLEAKDSAQVAAALAGGANASTASVESLGEALSQVGPGAKIAGLSLQDTVAALSAFDNAGIKGSDAGTSLKTFLTRLVPSTKAARQEMQNLGIITADTTATMKFLNERGIEPVSNNADDLTGQMKAYAMQLLGVKTYTPDVDALFIKMAESSGLMTNRLFDANGNIRSMSEVSETLQKALKNQTKEQKIATLNTIFGSDATRAAAVLADNGAKGLEKYVAAVNDQSQAELLAANATKGFAGAKEALGGGIETLQIQIGTYLLPVLTRMANYIAKTIVPAVSSLVEEFGPKLGPAMKSVGQQLITVGQGFATVAGFVSRNLDVIGPLVIGLVTGAAVIKTVSLVTRAWAAAQAILNIALAANPIGLVIIGISALVIGLVVAYKKSETFRKIVNAAFTGVKTVALAVFNWLKTAVVAVIGFVKNNWGLIKAILTGPLGLAVTLIRAHWSSIRGAFTSAVNWVKGAFKSAWNTVKDIVTLPLRLAVTAAGILLGPNGIRAKFTGAVNWVKGAFRSAWAGVKQVVTSPIQSAKDAIGIILGKTGLQSVFSKAVSAVGRIWDGIKALAAKPIVFVIDTVIGGLVSAFNNVAGVLPGVSKITAPALPKGLQGYTTGGILPGSSSWRDGDSVPVMARPGEGWTVSEALRDPYERNRLLALNKAAVRGQSAAQFRAGFDGQRFAKGGLVASADGGTRLSNRRVSFRGGTFTEKFAARLQAAERIAGEQLRIFQGGFRPSTSYSGTSHQGDALDFQVSNALIKALRSLGVPAWDRTGKGNWVPHTHAVPLPSAGYPAGSAVYQGQDYLSGGDGLGGRDNGPKSLSPIGGALSFVTDIAASLKDKFTGPLGKLKSLGSSPLVNLAAGAPKALVAGMIEKAKSAIPDVSSIGSSIIGKIKHIAGIDGLNGAQLKNASTIISVAKALGFGERGAIIGLMTAMQESRIRELNYGDRDSVGVFQQRTPWGSRAARMNTASSAEMFFNGGRGGQPGLRSKNWRNLPYGVAAQQVQVSAFPSAYDQWEGLAKRLVDKGYYTGTPSAAPGLAWVGERGPELVRFKGGEQVYDSKTSKQMSGQTFNVGTIQGYTAAEVADHLARKAAQQAALNPIWS